MVLETEARAVGARRRIAEGVSFERLAREHSVDPSAPAGGYLGAFIVSELREEFQTALAGLVPGEVSPVTRLENRYVLLQILTEEELDWMAHNETGFRAFDAGRNADAIEALSAAVDAAAGLEADRLAQSLANLAEAHRLQGRFSEAEPLYDRAVTLYEETLGPEHPDLALTLNNQALLFHAQGDHARAEPLYRRAVAVFERALGPDHPTTRTSRDNLVALAETLTREALERFADVVSLASFRDAEFDRAMDGFKTAITRAAVDEGSCLDITRVLVQQDMETEAEWMLMETLRRFPESREALYQLAELHVRSGAIARALGEFQQAGAMPGPPDVDPELDARMRAFLFRRIGDLYESAGRIDEAVTAYSRALDLDPSLDESRLGLGTAYFRLGRSEEALGQLTRVLAEDPENMAALNRLAEVQLGLGRFEEAAAAAALALRIDPGRLPSRLFRARALAGMGRREEGNAEMQAYLALEAEARAEEQRLREIAALDRDAMAAFLEERHEEAIGLYRRAIDSHPEVALFYFKLGLAQSKLGRHRDAVETFRMLIELGLSDDFLVHKNLAAAYAMLGDSEASVRHERIYLEKRNAEMETGPED